MLLIISYKIEWFFAVNINNRLFFILENQFPQIRDRGPTLMCKKGAPLRKTRDIKGA